MSFGQNVIRQPYPVYQQAAPAAAAQSQAEMQTEADKAAEEVKKKARKAGSGRAATIATSPLGVVSPVQSTVKALLGS